MAASIDARRLRCFGVLDPMDGPKGGGRSAVEQRVDHRLTTALAADVVGGYSRLLAADEAGTLVQLKIHRKDLIEPKTAEYHGRVVKHMGDGTLMEFGSAVDTVNFAVNVQQATDGRAAVRPLVGVRLGRLQ
jgi:class 3 adenylate cyclase